MCRVGIEAKIAKLAAKHKKVWYLADSVYFIYGDYADFDGLNAMLRKYKTINIYMDDKNLFRICGIHVDEYICQSCGQQPLGPFQL